MFPVENIPDLTGEFVGSRYELSELLGSGAFGAVYKAFDHCFCQDVAVKVMPIADRTDADLGLIVREIEMHLAASTAEGVVKLLDVVREDEWCSLVLEFCPDGDMYARTAKGWYAGNDELTRTAFLSLVDAVEAMHDAGVAHRDLKPENIMTNKDGSRLYLADFGLATDEVNSTEFSAGTYMYMSPECIGEFTANEPYNPYVSDIWSMGIILVNMLSGCDPWSKAVPTDKRFCRFLMDQNYFYHTLSISEGANAILRAMFLHPSLRVSLRDLREAILSLDSFYRSVPQCEYVVPEYELPTTELSTIGSELEYESTTKAPEIDIPCAASEPAVRVARDCSAGSAVDAQFMLGTGGFDSWSGSRASSAVSSEEAITPEGTIPTTILSSKASIWDASARMMADGHLWEIRHGCQNIVHDQ